MRIINIIGTKGGVGTTTVAATIAIELARAGERVAVIDQRANGDLEAVLGADVANVTIIDTVPDETDETYDYAIVDHATTTTQPATGTNIVVLTNCYLSILHATKLTWRADAVVAILESHRALDRGDITAVLATPEHRVVTIAHDPAIARTIDAGLLATRFPPPLRRAHFTRFVYDLAVDRAN